MTRHFWVLVHRYINLTIGVLLIVTAITGSILAFNSELERIFAPQLFAPMRVGVPKLDLATLAVRAEHLLPQARVIGVTFTEVDQVSVFFAPRIDPATGKAYKLGFTHFFVDPWTGAELGRRMRGDLSQGLINLMPFIYILHFELFLGPAGMWILGLAALIWTFDCFVGFYLTLPVSFTAFFRRWRGAWIIKREASFYRLNVDLHRASGLWLWPWLFIFAWSSVMLDLRPTYEWITHQLFDYRSPREATIAMRPSPNDRPVLDWTAALQTGERLAREQSFQHNFEIREPLGLGYLPSLGSYRFEFRSSRDLFERAPKGGSTVVWFDGVTGEFKRLDMPTGVRTGNTIESWLYALHMDRIFGLPFQIFTFLLGLALTMLGVTGLYIWWKKRRAQNRMTARRRRLRGPPKWRI